MKKPSHPKMYGSNCELPLLTVVPFAMVKSSCHHILTGLQAPLSSSSTKSSRKNPKPTCHYQDIDNVITCTNEKQPPCLIHGDGLITNKVKSGVNSAFSFRVWDKKKRKKRVLTHVLILYGYSWIILRLSLRGVLIG